MKKTGKRGEKVSDALGSRTKQHLFNGRGRWVGIPPSLTIVTYGSGPPCDHISTVLVAPSGKAICRNSTLISAGRRSTTAKDKVSYLGGTSRRLKTTCRGAVVDEIVDVLSFAHVGCVLN